MLTILERAAAAGALDLLVVDVEVEGMIVCSDRPLLYARQEIEYGYVLIIRLSVDTARTYTEGAVFMLFDGSCAAR